MFTMLKAELIPTMWKQNTVTKFTLKKRYESNSKWIKLVINYIQLLHKNQDQRKM